VLPSAAITFISSQIAVEPEKPLFVGCTERASQPGGICRNVIDVDETLIKITTADTVVTARLPLTLTFLLRRRRLLEWHRSHRPRWP
jgi:hypothetical protein